MKVSPSGSRLAIGAAAVALLATVVALVDSRADESDVWTALDRGSSETSSRSETGPAFVDVAADSGLDVVHGAFQWGPSADPVAMMGGGVCWIDYDTDGWMDLFVVNTYAEAEWSRWQDAGGLPTSRLYRNEAGRFVDVTVSANAGLSTRGLGCVAGDIDADGDSDLYVTTATANALLLNDGQGSFREVADESGVAAYGWHTSSVMGDLDGDGLIDLFVAGYVNLNRPVESSTEGFPRTFEALPDLIYRNLGVDADGLPHFEEVGTSAGLEPVALRFGLGSLLTDVDLDGDLDLYVANDTDANQLYLNESEPGKVNLVESGAVTGVDDAHSGMGVAAADLSRNGSPDLAVTNLDYQLHGVFGNGGAARFDAIGASSGISSLEGEYTGWGVMGADFDGDTDLDLMVVNGNVPVVDPEADRQPLQLFANLLSESDRLTFEAIDIAIEPIVGRGAASADFDNDGDLDVAISQISGPLILLRNDGAVGHTLTVEFSSFSPGARVVVHLGDGSRLTREVLAGSSYLSSEDPRLHFGLAEATIVETVAVTMPDGESFAFSDVAADGVLRVP